MLRLTSRSIIVRFLMFSILSCQFTLPLMISNHPMIGVYRLTLLQTWQNCLLACSYLSEHLWDLDLTISLFRIPASSSSGNVVSAGPRIIKLTSSCKSYNNARHRHHFLIQPLPTVVLLSVVSGNCSIWNVTRKQPRNSYHVPTTEHLRRST